MIKVRLKQILRFTILSSWNVPGYRLQKKFPNWRIESSARFMGEADRFEFSGSGIISHFNYLVASDERGGENSKIEIGNLSYIGEGNSLRAAGGSILIGEKVLISQNVSIIASNHLLEKEKFIVDQPWDLRKVGVKVGDGVWIGCNSTILPGVEIGAGAVIGAGSVITKSVPENAIVVGSPARVLRFR